MKGPIVIHTIPDCLSCSAAIDFLNENNLRFNEIKIMHEKEERNSYPKIYFNGNYIGGTLELQSLLKDKIQQKHHLEMLQPTPTRPSKNSPDTKNLETDMNKLDMDVDNNTIEFYQQLVQKMKNPNTGIIITDRKYHFKTYKNCFIGNELVDWLCNNYNISRLEAVEVGDKLRKYNLLHHVVEDHVFKDKYLFYRFSDDKYQKKRIQRFYSYSLDDALSKPRKRLGSISFRSKYDSKVIKSPTNEDPKIELITQFNLLQQVFPDFPSKMLSILFFREDGNSQQLAKKLICNYGWKPSSTDSLSLLIDEYNIIFTTDYFWGKFKSEYLSKLKKARVGSYFTAINDNDEYIVCFISQDKTLSELKILQPNIPDNISNDYSMDFPLTRPSCIVPHEILQELN